MKKFTQHNSLNRGNLLSIPFKDIGLNNNYKRLFVVTDVPAHTQRGGHAHKENDQVLICIKGLVKVMTIDYLDNEKVYKSHVLGPGEWIDHPHLQWVSLEFLDKNTVFVSLCTHDYDPNDYLHTKYEWIKYMDSI